MAGKRVFRDVRGNKFVAGQEIVIAKMKYSVHTSGSECAIRTVSKIENGKVYVLGSNGKGNHWLRCPECAVIL